MKSCQCRRLPAQLGYFELRKFMLAPTFRNRLLWRLGMGTPEIIWRSLAGQFTTVLCLEVLQQLTNFYFSFTDCILPCWILEPGGTQVKMGYSYVPPLRPLFHALFPKTAISEFFSSSRSYIRLKSQISGKFAFQSLKIEEKFSSYA